MFRVGWRGSGGVYRGEGGGGGVYGGEGGGRGVYIEGKVVVAVCI